MGACVHFPTFCTRLTAFLNRHIPSQRSSQTMNEDDLETEPLLPEDLDAIPVYPVRGPETLTYDRII